MPIKDSLLPEFDHEMATTRRVLERVPEAEFAWKPHEKSMSLGQLAGHIATLPYWCTATLETTTLDLDALATVPEEDAIAAIAALRGFGRWSAEIYLLAALGRADSFPADDLGLQAGMQKLKRLEMRPNRKAMDLLAEPWRPLRGCGAIFLWHYYGAATLDE